MTTANPWLAAAELFDPQPDPYLTDPAGWVRDRTGEDMWSKQTEIMEAVRDHRRVAVKACHGPGKSWTAARLVAWWIDTHPAGDAIAVTSAPSWPQVKAILWREIRAAHTKAGLPGRVTLDCNWTLDDGILVAFGRKPADHDEDGFQGIHARYVLVVLDEGCGIPAQLVRAASTLLTNEDARILIIGNPDDPGSEFARLCDGAPDDGPGLSGLGWWTITIAAEDTPNFTGEPVSAEMRQVLVSKLWVEEFMRDVGGVESPLYVSKVLGRFPADTADGVVPWSWLNQCRHGDPEHVPSAGEQLPIELGVDVGGSDNADETVIYERRGARAGRRWSVRSSDPEIVLRKVEEAIREARPQRVKIDSIGIGWGIMGGLRRSRPDVEVVGVNVAEAASEPSRFVNKRAEIWWTVGRELSKDRGWDLTGVDHDSTFAELAAPRWTENTAGRIQIESKDEIRRRIGRSTDNADALLLAFYNPKSREVREGQYVNEALTGSR